MLGGEGETDGIGLAGLAGLAGLVVPGGGTVGLALAGGGSLTSEGVEGFVAVVASPDADWNGYWVWLVAVIAGLEVCAVSLSPPDHSASKRLGSRPSKFWIAVQAMPTTRDR